MTHLHATDTDDSAIPAALRRFLRNRLLEACGIGLLLATSLLSVALATWSLEDPSRNHAIDKAPENWLGIWGAYVSDELVQFYGLGVVVLMAVPAIWAFRMIAHKPLIQPVRQVVMWLAAAWLASGFLSLLTPPQTWVLGSGLGGGSGDVLTSTAISILSFGLKTGFARFLVFCAILFTFLATFFRAIGIFPVDLVLSSQLFGERSQDVIAQIFGIATHLKFRLIALFKNAIQTVSSGRMKSRHGLATTGVAGSTGKPPSIRALIGSLFTRLEGKQPSTTFAPPATDNRGERIEPLLTGRPAPAPAAEQGSCHQEIDIADEIAADSQLTSERITRNNKTIKQSTRARKDAQPSFKFNSSGKYELPPVTLLAEARKSSRPNDLTDEALEQNARMLEGVLEDFGIRGEVINVRPGPVVTLYELEPAPGIKSSRVIGLADDIARSMSAISARVAVVPGRNAIGIELPNSTRETVYLREMLSAQAYEKTKQNLALALGKNIGGEPVYADLARMPHLLIAGTTGSGKSVGINTMILSLLYKHAPEKCKLIMIDPKMLELSVYEGIPHLLAPVVTDPRKAVVALKWAVREMEDRYRKMSKVGVRNIDGFNARIKQANKKGEVFTRTVQTGYHVETGEPIFEQEEMDLSPLPYIVVIIDEMADLMMVAGKDIEGAVQRLAQMARAAGIHVIMATQRPSVDVITGTIKANFPTRISFQVTSKIDSRTILGEQGAEQLLGQGDMLFMAGGGRISRLHGPFVSDTEVEEIVSFLKAQGAPDYVQAVTEEAELEANGPAGFEGGPSTTTGDETYDQAVAVVLRDKKVSTSYIQRRLQIGYNRAASLIERMEEEGLISAPNNAGKREILVGDPSVEP